MNPAIRCSYLIDKIRQGIILSLAGHKVPLESELSPREQDILFNKLSVAINSNKDPDSIICYTYGEHY